MEKKTSNPALIATPSALAVVRARPASQIAIVRAGVSRHINRPLPHYLTPDEAHLTISAADNARDRLFDSVLMALNIACHLLSDLEDLYRLLSGEERGYV